MKPRGYIRPSVRTIQHIELSALLHRLTGDRRKQNIRYALKPTSIYLQLLLAICSPVYYVWSSALLVVKISTDCVFIYICYIYMQVYFQYYSKTMSLPKTGWAYYTYIRVYCTACMTHHIVYIYGAART